jgi:hypothetical protein
MLISSFSQLLFCAQQSSAHIFALPRRKHCPDFYLGLLFDCFRLWANPTTGTFYFFPGLVNYRYSMVAEKERDRYL